MPRFSVQQRILLQAADKYSQLGYSVGMTKGKSYLGRLSDYWQREENHKEFDGVSLVPDNLVCVDIDINDFGVVWEPLPPTFKERSPRGWHLFYGLPPGSDLQNLGSPKIKWRPHVDLLIKTTPAKNKLQLRKKPSRYNAGDDDKEETPWGEHVLVSPTQGYTRIWPEEIPHKDKLTPAPDWLVDTLLKQ